MTAQVQGGAPAEAAALVGRTIAERFELLAFAAAGGMGHVYRARDVSTGKTVALKLLAPSTGDAERFEREAAMLSKIDHPGVVRYVDHGATADGAQYLAMEWLSGEDLADRLGVDGTLAIDETITLALRAAEALAAAHRAGIVHRDLKPANLFLVERRLDGLRLVDFGVARAETQVDITVTGAVVGTPAYMSPEQVRGDPVDPRADVYGLGAVLYRCLAGRPPFRGAHPLAVLAKVVIEPPQPLRELRADVPPALEALVGRLLAKDPAQRPADGAALLDELGALGKASAVSERRLRAAAISAQEQRVACVVLCSAGGSVADEVTVAAGRGGNEEAIRRAVERRGGAVDALAKGAWLITIPHAASPAEQAARAARCALALAAIRPGTPLFVATGRMLVTGEGHVGEVIDRAADALVAAGAAGGPGGVRVDVPTAELLEGRFRVGEAEEAEGAKAGWRRLLDEVDSVAPARTLLGKPALCVGREPQLAMLGAALSACAAESRAGAALVVAPPGLGKTHLVHELLRGPAAGGVDVLFAGGDPIRAASALGMAAQVIGRAAEIRADRAQERAAKLSALVARDFGEQDVPRIELLGEICGVMTAHAQASPALRAARADAMVMADALRDAWTSWLAARAARAPVLLLLEDVHWADPASLRLVEAATAALADRPLYVLATARPEGAAAFVDRFRAHGVIEMTLGPLPPVAAERLVRAALGAEVGPDLPRALARRSAGHPFHLEELVRAVADGRGADALPESVLGMVQARLDDLGADARRALRAASVFGETFRSAGVSALLGDELPETALRAALSRLVAQEVVSEERGTRGARGRVEDDGRATYRFRHMLFRDAAYATLAEADCVRAHRRAGAWLEETGAPDPAVLGEHYDRGRAPEQAVTCFRRAAAQALQRNDYERAGQLTARALGLGPDASAEAALRAIEAEILYWRGELVTAAERAPSAVARLPRGAPEWFDAVSVAVGALGQLGRNDEVTTLLRDAAAAAAPSESRGAQVVALCRGMTQLFWAHAGAGLDDVRTRLDALVDRPEPLDAYQAGWVHRARGESAWLHRRDVGRCLTELAASSAAFEAARAARPLCLSRLNAASLSGWSGDVAGGLALVASARAEAERLGAGFLLRYGGAVEGLLLAYGGEARAESAMRQALEGLSGSPRLAFICHLVIGSLALDRGDVAAATPVVQAMEGTKVVGDLAAAGLALASRLARARGAPEEALRLAQASVSVAARCPDLELTHGLPALALAEVQIARGEEDAARAALAPVFAEVAAIAATIADPEQRCRFRVRPLANDRIARVALELGLGD